MVLPDSGEITFNNKSIFNETDYRNYIGYMPQIGKYPENMSIGQIVEMMKELRGSHLSFDEDLYKAYKLDQILNKRMRTLSGGTTQKVSAALAFMFNPLVYILDEPTAGLDPISAEILKEKMLLEKSKGKLILITSHLLSDLEELVSEIVFMQDGELLIHQTVEELKNKTGEEKLSKAISTILKAQLI
jgi:Cu-processing system ATP-binding protein